MRYLNIKNETFMFIDNIIGPAIEASIHVTGRRLLKWGDQGMEGEQICSDETQIPKGWSLAYDLDLQLAGIDYRLTIHEGAIKYAFKPYLSALCSRNQSLQDVVTRIRVLPGAGGHGVLKFEVAVAG